jgi:hypothetical protein
MPTVADVHTVGTIGGVDEFAAVSDAEIQELIDEVTPQYSGRVLGPPKHVQRDKAIVLHVAHLLHLSLAAAGAGGGQLGDLLPTTTRQLEGVGSRGKGGNFGNIGGQGGADPMEIPSRYLWRLTMIRRSMMPSVDTTGGGTSDLAGWSGIPYGGNGWY